MELNKTSEQEGRPFTLVAATDGKKYSTRIRLIKRNTVPDPIKTWTTTEEQVSPSYELPEKFVPFHLKNLKTGCKLFLESYWPGYKRTTSKVPFDLNTPIDYLDRVKPVPMRTK